METDKWVVTHKGSGRGVMTVVTFADGRSVKLSGRLTVTAAVEQVSGLLRDWTTLGMVDDALGPIEMVSSDERFARVVDSSREVRNG